MGSVKAVRPSVLGLGQYNHHTAVFFHRAQLENGIRLVYRGRVLTSVLEGLIKDPVAPTQWGMGARVTPSLLQMAAHGGHRE